MEQILSQINEEIDKKGRLFAAQSREAMGDVSSFVSAVRYLTNTFSTGKCILT